MCEPFDAVQPNSDSSSALPTVITAGSDDSSDLSTVNLEFLAPTVRAEQLQETLNSLGARGYRVRQVFPESAKAEAESGKFVVFAQRQNASEDWKRPSIKTLTKLVEVLFDVEDEVRMRLSKWKSGDRAIEKLQFVTDKLNEYIPESKQTSRR